MRRNQAVEAAYKDGVADGRAAALNELLPFRGVDRVERVTSGARFRFERSWPQSVLKYERAVAHQLRMVQRARSRERVRHAAPTDELFARFQSRVLDELRLVRESVDAERELGHVKPAVVEAMRRAPNRPPGVEEYLNAAIFLEEDPRRGTRAWSDQPRLGGTDYGYNWGLENPLRPWERTSWRISWLEGLSQTWEVYAVELLRDHGVYAPIRDGRVWLLGTSTSQKDLEAAILDLELYAQEERNSLVVAADAVRAITPSNR